MRTVRWLMPLTAVALFLVAPLVIAPPVEAYDVFLTQWNVSQLETAGDQVKVTVSGNTITFTWIDGNGGIDPDATNIKTINWSNAVVTVAGAATGSGDYSTINDNGPASKDWVNADGFGKFRVDVNDADPSKNDTTTVSFTFSKNLDATAFTATDFALHVQYSNSCSGWVSGDPENKAGSESNCAATTTVVPEPLTVFLGGTGLLALGYAGRKRLFGRFAS